AHRRVRRSRPQVRRLSRRRVVRASRRSARAARSCDQRLIGTSRATHTRRESAQRKAQLLQALATAKFFLPFSLARRDRTVWQVPCTPTQRFGAIGWY